LRHHAEDRSPPGRFERVGWGPFPFRSWDLSNPVPNAARLRPFRTAHQTPFVSRLVYTFPTSMWFSNFLIGGFCLGLNAGLKFSEPLKNICGQLSEFGAFAFG